MKMLRVAVLVDLPRMSASGGHVKYWERIAQAAVHENIPVELTVYYSGEGPDEVLSPQVRLRFLPPAFSTSRLKFLPYVPSHTDLAPFHARLARELPHYDVIHTTDGFFAMARTAERIAKWCDIPLVTSFHTDTPAYAELFTLATLEKVFGLSFGGWLARTFDIPRRERNSLQKRLHKHLQRCDAILAMRAEDIDFIKQATDPARINRMRLGVDKNLFAPDRRDREGVMRDYGVAPEKFLVLFVGRVDVGKNMHVLLQACVAAIEQRGVNLHLIVAGLGPMCDEVKAKLGNNATIAGQVEPTELARLYASVDCLAIASDIEIGGMIGPEALAAGCPVLVSRQSGVAQLCGDTPAMHMIESGVPPWAIALCEAARDSAKMAAMREAALAFRRDSLASWADVLRQDFLPVWEKAAQERTKDVR